MKRLLLLLLALGSLSLQAQLPEVSPLLTTEWGQDEPYNLQCPKYFTNNGEDHPCKAGCVAVAMAQVMNYYRYPMMTQARIVGYKNPVVWMSYKGEYGVPTEHTVTLKAIPQHAFLDWEQMCDKYSGGESTGQRLAVANLMLYAGESVVMKYDRSSSADPRSIAKAMKETFGYASSTRYVARAGYSDADWESLLYHELASGRPIIYGGLKSGGGGHSFIIDGYRDGLYHVNWGGEGYNNGYYPLNQMDPEGGDDGYNFEQDAIVGLSPYALFDDVSPAGGRADGRVYDLMRGRVATGGYLSPGIYIVAGRKVVVR